MLIKEYSRVWPPNVVLRNFEVSPKTNIRPRVEDKDLVLRVYSRFPKDHLGITLRKTDGTEYEVYLPIPPSKQEILVLSIGLKRNITLREIGEIALE